MTLPWLILDMYFKWNPPLCNTRRTNFTYVMNRNITFNRTHQGHRALQPVLYSCYWCPYNIQQCVTLNEYIQKHLNAYTLKTGSPEIKVISKVTSMVELSCRCLESYPSNKNFLDCCPDPANSDKFISTKPSFW